MLVARSLDSCANVWPRPGVLPSTLPISSQHEVAQYPFPLLIGIQASAPCIRRRAAESPFRGPAWLFFYRENDVLGGTFRHGRLARDRGGGRSSRGPRRDCVVRRIDTTAALCDPAPLNGDVSPLSAREQPALPLAP